jgi:hypothetical protein
MLGFQMSPLRGRIKLMRSPCELPSLANISDRAIPRRRRSPRAARTDLLPGLEARLVESVTHMEIWAMQ